MCQPRGIFRTAESRGSICGCGCGPFFRRFISAKEEKEMLEEYKDQIKEELAGVEERIKELKGK